MSEIIPFPTEWELLQARREAFAAKLAEVSMSNVIFIDFNNEPEDLIA